MGGSDLNFLFPLPHFRLPPERPESSPLLFLGSTIRGRHEVLGRGRRVAQKKLDLLLVRVAVVSCLDFPTEKVFCRVWVVKYLADETRCVG